MSASINLGDPCWPEPSSRARARNVHRWRLQRDPKLPKPVEVVDTSTSRLDWQPLGCTFANLPEGRRKLGGSTGYFGSLVVRRGATGAVKAV